MATSKIFKKVPITVPNRSGFNMSYNNFFSAPVGTLVPNHIDFLIPGDEVDLSSKLHVQLPPMATDFYGRIEAKEEAFFVPARILFGGWKDFFVNPADGITNPSNIDGQLAKYLIGAELTKSGILNLNSDSALYISSHEYPYTPVDVDLVSSYNAFERYTRSFLESSDYSFAFTEQSVTHVGAGSLCDYLGFKVSGTVVDVPETFKRSFYDDLFVPLDSLSLDIAAQSSQIVTSLENSSSYIKSLSARYFDYGDLAIEYTPSIYFLKVSPSVLRIHYLLLNVAVFFNGSQLENESIKINNILPFLAYHKVYDDWYRAPMIQQSLFKRNVANSSSSTSVANMPWITSGAENKVYLSGEQLNFANGHNLFALHQRNWQKDYFTSATPEPQAGDAASVKFDVIDDSGEFTIASLRAANALQQWLERNNIGGFRYGDMIYAQYGVYPSDAITDRAIYLGSQSVEVYNKSVYQQSGDGGTDTNNPFNAIGSKYSNPTGLGQGSFCNNYRVTEAGFIIKIFSLVPTAYYSTGVRRMFMYNDISDIAFPILAGVGDQPIFGYELSDVYSGDGDKSVFGYQQRYSEYKFIDDQVHGLLREGESLDSFALQRSFDRVPQLGSEFLEIPRDYLDQVSATSYKLSQYGCWVNCKNHYLKSSTLPAYSIPTLEDMKGHTVMVDKNGNYLA